MEKYTKEQKLEVAKFFEEGFSAREIFEVTNIPVGTLYRWKHEAKASDPKARQVVPNTQLEELQARVSELEADPKAQQVVPNTQLDELQARVSELEAELAEISKWVALKKKAEAKEYGEPSTFKFKRAGQW